MSYRKPFAMCSLVCEICLTPADRSRLKLRDLSAFYTLNRAFEGIADANAWLCIFCSTRAAQFIQFVDTARTSRILLTELSSGVLATDLKPTDLHPYTTRGLPDLVIQSASDPKKDPNSKSKTDPGSRSSPNNMARKHSPKLWRLLQNRQIKQESGMPSTIRVKQEREDEGLPEEVKQELNFTHVQELLEITVEEFKPEANQSISYGGRSRRSTAKNVRFESAAAASADDTSDEDFASTSLATKKRKIAARKKTAAKKKKETKQKRDEAEKKFIKIQMSDADMLKCREDDRKRRKFSISQLKCESCIMGFFTEEKYQRHIATRHTEECGRFACPICQSRFPTLKQQRGHTKKAHYVVLKCPMCDLRDRCISKMTRHYEETHQNLSLPCKMCSMEFPSQYMRSRHLENVHLGSRECTVCSKVLCNRTSLAVHMKVTHGEVPIRECPVCQKKIRGDRLLKVHMRTHTQEPDPNAYCAECDMRFKNFGTYKNHLKYNLKHRSPDDLKHECTDCGIKFASSTNLKAHISVVHLKKTKHVCPHCDKNEVSAYKLKVHIRKVHDQIPDVKDKVCEICDRPFASNRFLRNHMRTHTGERPFHCQSCGATFAQSAALYTHNRLIHLKLKAGEKKQRRVDTL